MTRLPALVALVLCLGPRPVFAQESGPGLTIPVDSPAFVFSPGNWSGDDGRGGSRFRQTWCAGAYFRVSWTTTSANPSARLLLDFDGIKAHPQLVYNVDGVWSAQAVGNEDHVTIAGLSGPGAHTLAVYVRNSAQADRWGSPGVSGTNVVRVAGLLVDSSATPGTAAFSHRWALIVGDSISEGILADDGQDDNLACWSYLVGQALQAAGYEYGISACGYSGWLRPGDATHDVPAYYLVSGSQNGAGGRYDDANSRWNKIDGNGHSLLDSAGHLSAYGGTGQEPSLILFNLATNDALSHVDSGDLQASIAESLVALRKAAPSARIGLIVPFGQYGVAELRRALGAFQAANPGDGRTFLIDLGPAVAAALAANNYWAGLHPNLRGHAVFAGRILAALSALSPPLFSN